MVLTDRRQSNTTNIDISQPRRLFLQSVLAAGTTLALWPGPAKAVMELWEEGDPLCQVQYQMLAKPEGYELDLAYLESFLAVSTLLTGVSPLDRQLANEYMERYAIHPQLTTNLNALISAYRAIPGTPSENDVAQKIIGSTDPVVKAAAKQLMYLWYVSAFFIPLDVTPGVKPPLRDDPNDTRKRVWVYGSPEQYAKGLLWKVIYAHAPMTPGPSRHYWAIAPRTS